MRNYPRCKGNSSTASILCDKVHTTGKVYGTTPSPFPMHWFLYSPWMGCAMCSFTLVHLLNITFLLLPNVTQVFSSCLHKQIRWWKVILWNVLLHPSYVIRMFHWTMKTLIQHVVSLEWFLVLPEILNSGLVNSAWALERITRTGLVLGDDLSVEAVALKICRSSKRIQIDVHAFLWTKFTGVYKNIGRCIWYFHALGVCKNICPTEPPNQIFELLPLCRLSSSPTWLLRRHPAPANEKLLGWN